MGSDLPMRANQLKQAAEVLQKVEQLDYAIRNLKQMYNSEFNTVFERRGGDPLDPAPTKLTVTCISLTAQIRFLESERLKFAETLRELGVEL
jgi:hypothetical protein